MTNGTKQKTKAIGDMCLSLLNMKVVFTANRSEMNVYDGAEVRLHAFLILALRVYVQIEVDTWSLFIFQTFQRLLSVIQKHFAAKQERPVSLKRILEPLTQVPSTKPVDSRLDTDIGKLWTHVKRWAMQAKNHWKTLIFYLISQPTNAHIFI